MKKILFLFLMAFSPLAQANGNLSPFTTDGCSAFNDSTFIVAGKSWSHCCVVHDFAYWRGGTKQERKQADKALGKCVNKSFRWLMWAGVKIGGAPYSSLGGNPFGWGWGYGWDNSSSYREITMDEKNKIKEELIQTRMNLPNVLSELELDEKQIQYIQQALDKEILQFTQPSQATTERRDRPSFPQ